MGLLIVPTDFSPNAEKALDQALLLAKQTGDQVELLEVFKPVKPKISEKEEKEKLKQLVVQRIDALQLGEGVRWRAKVLFDGNFIHALIRRFKNCKAKLVIIGTHGAHALADKIFESDTAGLIGKAEIPVLAIPPNWSPASIQKLSVCLMPEQVSHHAKLIQKWSGWLGGEVEGLYFTMMPGALSAVKSPFPFHEIPSPVETPLYEDLAKYSAGRKGEALAMFVHKRSFFQKIFDYSITKKAAGLVEVPLLALPVSKGE
ncbi:MAG: universal stress protein [Bacteroidota bacterium]